MKAIMISIRPRHCANIFNGLKTSEIRKTAPKEWTDYLSGKTKEKPQPMKVNIYCTKDKQFLFKDIYAEKGGYKPIYYLDNKEHDSWSQKLNGKVIASFILEDVMMFKIIHDSMYDNMEMPHWCLTHKEVEDYLGKKDVGFEWCISNLEIFDTPKELSDFYKVGVDEYVHKHAGTDIGYLQFWNGVDDFRLTKAPQSWQFIHFTEDTEEEE